MAWSAIGSWSSLSRSLKDPVMQLAALPSSKVRLGFVTSRQPSSPTLEGIAEKVNGRVMLIQLDPTDRDSLRGAVELKGLEAVVDNSGIHSMTQGKVFQMDATLTHEATERFMRIFEAGKATVASITWGPKYRLLPDHAYEISKAGLDMLTIKYALDSEDKGFSVYACKHMGGENADLPVETSAEAVLKYVRQDGKESNGRYWDVHIPGWENAPEPNKYLGGDAPW
ncbi:hypothetical protein BDW71DRAFT_193475 [Aspergillus fruticulosus]